MTILRIIHMLIKMMKITLELSDPVVMQLKHARQIYSIKILATVLLVEANF